MNAQRRLRGARRMIVWPMLLVLAIASPLVRSAPLDAASPMTGVEPGAGQWQTWVLQAGSELRPPAPPDKATSKKELAELEVLAAHRDAAALADIGYWDAGSPGYRWTQIAIDQVNRKPINVPRFNRLLALLHVAIYDGMIAAWDAKYAYARPRPSELDHKFVTVIPNPDSPSYPDERAVAAGAAAAILSYLYPDDTRSFADLANAAAQSRHGRREFPQRRHRGPGSRPRRGGQGD